MRSLFTAVLAATAISLTACASPGAGGGDTGSGGATEKVTVGVIPIVDVAPIYLGKEKGFFSKRGIELQLESGQGGAAIVPGVVSGQFQFGFSNVTSLLVARDKGIDLKIVANGNSSTGQEGRDFGAVVVRADSPIRTAKDLEGKTVSVNTLKNIGDSTVRASVRKAGGDPKAVRFVELAFPDMPAALENRRVDAAWVVEPFLTVAKSQGARAVAWNFVDTAPDLTVAAYFTSAKQLDQKSDLVKRFSEAMNESLEYARAHEDEVRQVITTYTRITKDQVGSLTLPEWPTKVNNASVDTLADLAVQDGLVSKQPDVSALLP
jgi:NitT/TauT family transport system substrate-binding protein